MSSSRLALAEPLTLGESVSPRSARCTGKTMALLSLLIGLVFAVVLLSLVPSTSGGDGLPATDMFVKPATSVLKKPATAMFGGPLAFRPRTGLTAPSVNFPPKFSVNAITRETKEEQVAKLKENIEKSPLAVITKWDRLTVPETNKMRLKLRDGTATYQVIKNTLAGIALKGTPKEELTQFLDGPMAMIYAEDPVQGAKAIKEVLEDLNTKDDERLKVEGAVLESQLLDPKGLEKVATLPSMDETRTKLAILLKQPATKLATVTKAVPQQLARAIQLAIDEKKFPE